MIVLSEFEDLKNWEEIKEKVINNNLLKKRSSAHLTSILNAIKNRFFTENELPNTENIANFIISNVSQSAKNQVIYIYNCYSDALIQKLILDLVKPTLLVSNKPKLNKTDFNNFLNMEARAHPELLDWSDSVKGKWIRSFLSILRQFGIMMPAPKFDLTKFTIRIESFTFFLMHLLSLHKPFTEILDHTIWKFYFLSSGEVEDLFLNCQKKGWIHYLKADNISEIKMNYSSLEEWISNALG